ncbi:hypothetical protein LCGC14_2124650, partial [marine sediment metagenome]
RTYLVQNTREFRSLLKSWGIKEYRERCVNGVLNVYNLARSA